MKRHSCPTCNIRGKKTTRVSFSLPEETYAMVKEEAKRANMTISAFIRHALSEALDSLSLETE